MHLRQSREDVGEQQEVDDQGDGQGGEEERHPLRTAFNADLVGDPAAALLAITELLIATSPIAPSPSSNGVSADVLDGRLAGMWLIVRKGRPHPLAHLCFTDVDGMRLTQR
ncbi:hypothetical protein GCM10018779_05380 [Streptomyces griseocarneus]|nr:hypothetical protein GCM10018779_05380 [Streptomyces griseocarneus]